MQWMRGIWIFELCSSITLNQSSQRTADAMPVRLNLLGQNDVNNCLVCVAWLAHFVQGGGKLFLVQLVEQEEEEFD